MILTDHQLEFTKKSLAEFEESVKILVGQKKTFASKVMKDALDSQIETFKQEIESYHQRRITKQSVHESIKSKVLAEYEKGNIVFSAIGGLQVTPLRDFITQPLSGMLYDLNRDEAVILNFIEDQKWINDYALSKTVSILKRRLEIAEIELESMAENNDSNAIDALRRMKNISK